MPGTKKILVDGREYPYLLKFGSARLSKETSRIVQVTIQLDSKKFIRARFESKLWTQEHTYNHDVAPIHKNSFTPKDIAAVIKGLVHGQLPANFDLPTWRLSTDHERVS